VEVRVEALHQRCLALSRIRYQHGSTVARSHPSDMEDGGSPNRPCRYRGSRRAAFSELTARRRRAGRGRPRLPSLRSERMVRT
jgi:hypothetical protein